MNRRTFLAALTPILAACASTYAPPASLPPATVYATTMAPAAVLAAARRELTAQGFAVVSADAEAGTLSTAPRDWPLTPAQADCGTTLGLDYLKDPRTARRLSWHVVAVSGRVTLRAAIEADYRPGAVDQNITLTCTSRGELERDLAARIGIAG